jgi:hypothetical protein
MGPSPGPLPGLMPTGPQGAMGFGPPDPNGMAPQTGGPAVGGPIGGNTQPVGKAAGSGGWQAQGGGQFGPNGGGAMGMAVDAGSMALDAMAPGAGQAAQTASKLINRTIQYGGQLASIGVSGLLETFGLSDSQLGDPSKSWIGRIASGVSGMSPAVPTSAGQTQAPAKPQEHASQQGQGSNGQGPTVHIENLIQRDGQSSAQLTNDIAFRSYAGKGRP